MLGVLVVAGVLHLLARTVGGGWLALGSAAVIVLPVVAVLLRPRLAGLRVERVLHGQPVVGSETEVTLRLVNDGRRGSAPVLLADLLPGHAPLRVAFPALGPGARAEVRLTRAAVARVSTAAGTAQLTASAPLGLLRASQTVALPGRVVVHPAPAPRPYAPDGTGTLGSGGARTRPVAGVGTEVLGLRDWRPGESARSVSARASARHGRPLVLERERETASRLVVLIGGGSGPGWEQALSEAAALAVTAVRQARLPVLLGVPGGSAPRSSALSVLDAVAAADDAPPLTPTAVAAALRSTGAGGALVVVTGDLTDGRDLRRQAAAARTALVVLGA